MIYQGIRLTPEEIVAAAVAEDVDLVGISILSGSHMDLVPCIVEGLRSQGLDDVPVVVGGIIPAADAARLKDLGVAAVFTPKDFGLTAIMAAFVEEIRRAKGLCRRCGIDLAAIRTEWSPSGAVYRRLPLRVRHRTLLDGNIRLKHCGSKVRDRDHLRQAPGLS